MNIIIRTLVILASITTPCAQGYTKIGTFNALHAANYTGAEDTVTITDTLLNKLDPIPEPAQKGIIVRDGPTYVRFYEDTTLNEASKGVIYQLGRRDKPWVGHSCKETEIRDCQATYKKDPDGIGYIIEHSGPLNIPTPTIAHTLEELKKALGIVT